MIYRICQGKTFEARVEERSTKNVMENVDIQIHNESDSIHIMCSMF